jgi:hypothetical protein
MIDNLSNVKFEAETDGLDQGAKEVAAQVAPIARRITAEIDRLLPAPSG